MIGYVTRISSKLSRTLGARPMPFAGAKPGDHIHFDNPNLADAVLQPLPLSLQDAGASHWRGVRRQTWNKSVT
jgi:hypothetical protein